WDRPPIHLSTRVKGEDTGLIGVLVASTHLLALCLASHSPFPPARAAWTPSSLTPSRRSVSVPSLGSRPPAHAPDPAVRFRSTPDGPAHNGSLRDRANWPRSAHPDQT